MKNFSFILALLTGLASSMPTPQTETTLTPFDSSVIIGQGDVSATETSCAPVGTSSVGVSVSEAQVLIAAPLSKSCPADTPECVTATTAAPLISAAFQNWGHRTLGQMAALIGLMTVESVDFQFNTNHYPAPGRKGQGTKAMLNFPFVYEYALAQPELNAEVIRLGGGQQLSVTFDNMDSFDVDTIQAPILALVQDNKYTFGAASWFLATQCDASYASQLTSGGFTAYGNYLANCVGAGQVTTQRRDGYCLAVKALKPSTMAMPTECP